MYKAQISASHAIVHESPPIKSFGDVLNSNYMLHVSNSSSTAKAFLNKNENTIFWKLSNAGKIISGPKDHEVLKRMTSGTLPSNMLLFGVYQPLRMRQEWSCNVDSVDIDYMEVSNGIIFKKNWKYTESLNYHLLKMQEEGIIDQIKKKYYISNAGSSCKRGQIEGATLTETKTVYILVAFGLVFSFLLFLCEYLHSKISI